MVCVHAVGVEQRARCEGPGVCRLLCSGPGHQGLALPALPCQLHRHPTGKFFSFACLGFLCWNASMLNADTPTPDSGGLCTVHTDLPILHMPAGCQGCVQNMHSCRDMCDTGRTKVLQWRSLVLNIL